MPHFVNTVTDARPHLSATARAMLREERRNAARLKSQHNTKGRIHERKSIQNTRR